MVEKKLIFFSGNVKYACILTIRRFDPNIYAVILHYVGFSYTAKSGTADTYLVTILRNKFKTIFTT